MKSILAAQSIRLTMDGSHKLDILEAESNQISDLTPLAGLKQLAWLDLLWNRVADVSPLVAETGIDGPGLQIDLGEQDPPFDCVAQAANIAALRARGVLVDRC